jgi:ABC-type antimicrobial peptide transport system permease subunit
VSDANGTPASVLATPAAVPVALLHDAVPQAVVELVPGAPDAADELRTAAARIDPTANVFVPAEAQEDHRFGGIRRGIYLGVAATLALIGASMLVALLESLRERRRSLAVLVAFGTPTRTLGWSVLLQAALPVVLGLALAVGVGVVLGGLLLSMVSRPVTLDWASIAVVCATGAGVVLGVTALGLPALWRLVRPDGLRTE